MKNAKALLYDVRDEQGEINIIRQQIAQAELALLPSGIRYDRDKVQASPDDPMLKMTVKLEYYEAELRKHQAALLTKRTKAFRMVSQLTDSTQRQVLELYFLGGRRIRMREVAQIVGYSEQSTYRIYKDALRNLESK